MKRIGNFKYPFLIALPALIFGIIAGNSLHIPFRVAFPLCLCGLFVSISRPANYRWATPALLISVFSLGLLISRQPKKEKFSENTNYEIRGYCREKLKNRNYIIRANGCNFLFHDKDSSLSASPGDSVILYGKIRPVKTSSIPHTFDYARYMHQKCTYVQIFPQIVSVCKGHSSNPSIRLLRIRETLMEKTDRIFRPSTSNLVKALCLGYRNDLENQMIILFRQTGTIHLLAVSGLHTGAIYLLAAFIAGCMGIPRRRRLFVAIPILWLYAGISGLSPSTIRAATILTFIDTGKFLRRDFTPFNALAGSAFISLCINPELLTSISFQLSYAAYSGIIFILPIVDRVKTGISKTLKYFRSVFHLSLSAQIAVFPLLAYYFHAFSFIGIAVNIIVIPLCILLLYTSAAVIALPVPWAKQAAFIPETMHEVIIRILRLCDIPSLIRSDLYPSPPEIVILYVFLILILFWLKYGKYITFVMLASFIYILQVSFHNHRISRNYEIVLFDNGKTASVLINKNGYYRIIASNDGSGASQIDSYIAYNKLKMYAAPPSQPPYYVCRSIRGNVCINRLQTAGPAYKLIITHDLQPPADKIRHIFPETVILNSTNKRTTIEKWKDFCKRHEINLIRASETGGLRIELK